MNSPKEQIDYEAFLDIAKKLTEEQYGEDNKYECFQDVLDDEAYTLSSPVVMEKQPIFNVNGITDLTKVKSANLATEIKKAGNLQIGKFLIKIKRYAGQYEQAKNRTGFLDINIFEEKNKIHKKINVNKDSRFKDVPWSEHFKDEVNAGNQIPFDTVVEIVRWLQVIDKLVAFI